MFTNRCGFQPIVAKVSKKFFNSPLEGIQMGEIVQFIAQVLVDIVCQTTGEAVVQILTFGRVRVVGKTGAVYVSSDRRTAMYKLTPPSP